MNNDISSDDSKKSESSKNIPREQIETEKREEEDDKESEEKEENNEEENEEEDNEKDTKKPKKETYEEFLIKLLTEKQYPRKVNQSLFFKHIKNNSKTSNNNSFLNKSNNHIITEPKKTKSNLNEFNSKSISKKFKKIIKSKSPKNIKKQKEIKQGNDLENKKSNFETKFKDYRFHLNYLYGYNKKFYYLNKTTKAHKNINLRNYQDKLMKVSSHNLSKDNMAKLANNLKSIRLNCELAEPLPPINYPALVHHSVTESTIKKKYGIKYSCKKYNEMDDYEREIQKIQNITRHKKIHQNTNRKLYKMYEILPEYVIEALFIKK